MAMDEVVSTPRLPVSKTNPNIDSVSKDQLFSSSPGFGTPAFPIQPRRPLPVQPFAAQTSGHVASTILPILLPPATLRPVAFRTLTKKHNLTLSSTGLAVLAQFIGKFCGSGWREDGLAEKFLDEIARQWKADNGTIILDDGVDKKLRNILKTLGPCMVGGRVESGKLSRSDSTAVGIPINFIDEFRPAFNRDDSQQSFGLSSLEVEDDPKREEELLLQSDARAYMKVISALEQPLFSYSTMKKTLEPVSAKPSFMPPFQHKISMFRNRYHLVHQRLLRNESFQTPSFTTSMNIPRLTKSTSHAATIQQAYKITPISNLLGRSGSAHLLLGLLIHNAAGDLALADLSSSVVLDMSIARPVPAEASWFCPGMILLVEGTYEENGSNTAVLGTGGGIGGQIRGHFIVETIAGPPAERREITLGTKHDLKMEKTQTTGAGFGWIDLLGVGSERAAGPRFRKIQKMLFAEDENVEIEDRKRSKVFIMGECYLDNPRTLEAIRAILDSCVQSDAICEKPLYIIMMGNFVSAASMAGSMRGGGSVEYKEIFDNLASVLSDFPSIISMTSFLFVPGDNDPWASSFMAGAATMLPRQGIPDLFTSRLKRVFNNANAESARKESEIGGEAIWTSNPARISLFGPVDEIVLFRDDISGRLRRNATVFPVASSEGDEEGDNEGGIGGQETIDPEMLPGELDRIVHEAASRIPATLKRTTPVASTIIARKLVKTLLDQGYMSPFSTSIRPIMWDYAASLNLYPLPSAFVLADADTPAFTLTYEGCHVMNPGRVLDEFGARKGVAKFIEYDIRTKRSIVREIRF